MVYTTWVTRSDLAGAAQIALAMLLADRLLTEAWSTFAVSARATVAVLLCGTVIAYAARIFPQRGMQIMPRIVSLGYAMPGTILALGILIAVGGLDRWIGRMMKAGLQVDPGLVLIGSGVALGHAYLARFLAISIGSVEAGLTRIPRSYEQSARTLGHGVGATFRLIHLPLSRAAMAAAGLLVFVDCMKELSATLLLRPLNFETLATHLSGEAACGTYEEAAIAALAIVVVGIVPVILLARVGRGSG